MPAYIITAEISDSSKLTALVEKLKSFGGFCPINKTSWAITADKTAVELRDSLAETISPADRLFVIRSGTEAAWRNSYGNDHNEWLKKYL
jgi:hypothetical protein